jgi:hypothetical protein
LSGRLFANFDADENLTSTGNTGKLFVAPVATANKPTREVNPVQDDMVIAAQCAFPVLAHIDGGEIVTNFTTRATS